MDTKEVIRIDGSVQSYNSHTAVLTFIEGDCPDLIKVLELHHIRLSRHSGRKEGIKAEALTTTAASGRAVLLSKMAGCYQFPFKSRISALSVRDLLVTHGARKNGRCEPIFVLFLDVLANISWRRTPSIRIDLFQK
jgi:hypothetical protein